MPINPVQFAHSVCDEFLRYLFSAFPLSDPDLREQFRRLLERPSSLDIPLVQGPFVSLSEAFAKGDPDPYVSDLNQDSGSKTAANGPDYVLHVHPGDNYGFPQCNGTQGPGLCGGFTSPFATFVPHTYVMGMAIISQNLYMTSFVGVGGKGPGGEVLKMPLSGGKPTPVLTGFVAPTVGLGTDVSNLYVGELTGQVFSIDGGMTI